LPPSCIATSSTYQPLGTSVHPGHWNMEDRWWLGWGSYYINIICSSRVAWGTRAGPVEVAQDWAVKPYPPERGQPDLVKGRKEVGLSNRPNKSNKSNKVYKDHRNEALNEMRTLLRWYLPRRLAERWWQQSGSAISNTPPETEHLSPPVLKFSSHLQLADEDKSKGRV